MDKPLWGLRVQAPFGAQVQRVQRVQRVEVAPLNYRRRLFIKNLYNRPGGRRKCNPPLVAYGTTFSPQAVGLWVLSNGAMSLQESIERFILSPGWGKVWRSRIRGRRAQRANQQNANQAL